MRGPKSDAVHEQRWSNSGQGSVTQVLFETPGPTREYEAKITSQTHHHYHLPPPVSQKPNAWGGKEVGSAARYPLACHLVIRYLLLSLAPPSAEFNESEKNYEVP